MKQCRPILGITLALFSASGAWAISPEDKCEADKNKIAGKYAFCRQKAEAKAILKGEVADYSKCDSKLDDKWGKAEQKATAKGTACIDSVSDTDIQSFVTMHSDAVASALDGGSLPSGFCAAFPATGQTTAYGAGSDGDVQAGAALSYTDNGDGTFTDNNTGLMWEKKNNAAASIHTVNNVYTWCADDSPFDFFCDNGTEEMDGTIKTVFLDTLNDVAGGGMNCFAGYCDWRIPNYKELISLLDLEVVGPAVAPALDQCSGCTDITLPTCSCTGPAYYWSSTTSANQPDWAWTVLFTTGDGSIGRKATNSPNRARAVRGGP